MSDRFTERLSGLTPAHALDRDRILIAAGRASARPNRLWIALTAALACSQALSLAVMVRAPRGVQVPRAADVTPLAPVLPAAEPQSEPEPPDALIARRRALESDGTSLPLEYISDLDPQPAPLRAFAGASLTID